MSLQCGLIGLPNVGKSTIFSALTREQAEIANYPFCTIDPNVGFVSLADERLTTISSLFQSQKTIPTTVRFVDIAGIIAGASEGEGLGNTFLAHIRECPLIAHVVRCFESSDIVHVQKTIDPIADFEIIMLELSLADIQTVEKQLGACKHLITSSNKQKAEQAKRRMVLLEQMRGELEQGVLWKSSLLVDEEEVVLLCKELSLLSTKQQIIIANVDEGAVAGGNDYTTALQQHIGERYSLLVLCGKIEHELGQIEDEAERTEFSEAVGLVQSGLQQLIATAFHQLGLGTFFTAGPNESRAWTFVRGSTVSEAVGTIHTDFTNNFIKATIYGFDDLIEHQSESALKQAGKVRTEGADYLLQDGDIVLVHAR